MSGYFADRQIDGEPGEQGGDRLSAKLIVAAASHWDTTGEQIAGLIRPAEEIIGEENTVLKR